MGIPQGPKVALGRRNVPWNFATSGQASWPKTSRQWSVDNREEKQGGKEAWRQGKS